MLYTEAVCADTTVLFTLVLAHTEIAVHHVIQVKSQSEPSSGTFSRRRNKKKSVPWINIGKGNNGCHSDSQGFIMGLCQVKVVPKLSNIRILRQPGRGMR